VTKAKESVTGHSPAGRLRFPCFITLAPSLTRCHRCEDQPVLAAVIDGMERRLDPLPLSMDGLAAAVAGGRWVAVMSPFSLLAHRAKPGHWWLTPPGGAAPPCSPSTPTASLLLAHDPQLAPPSLLARLLPDAVQADPNEPPPF
jgi:hypothetical protein